MRICRFDRARALLGARWNRSLSDRGSTTAETLALVVGLLCFVALIVFVGRLTQANTAVHQAADRAARAASLGRQDRAASLASAAGSEALSRSGLRCATQSTSAAVTTRGTVSMVTVTVTCSVRRSDLAPLGPGSQTLTATSTEVYDVRRAE